MKRITPEFAEIVGLLCAEGCHIIQYSNYFGKDRDRYRHYTNKKSERIEFYNKDTNLLKHLQRLLLAEFNYQTRITKHGKINICRRDIIKDIINRTELGHLNWRVPTSIMISEKNKKIRFLRGYFDGDGTTSNRVRIFSTNIVGLKQVSEIITFLKIKHTVPNPVLKKGRKPLYYIQISEKEKERFLNIIKPISKI